VEYSGEYSTAPIELTSQALTPTRKIDDEKHRNTDKRRENNGQESRNALRRTSKSQDCLIGVQ
jgi:hypothetical protein